MAIAAGTDPRRPLPHLNRDAPHMMDEPHPGHAHRETIGPGAVHSSRAMRLSEVGAGALLGSRWSRGDLPGSDSRVG